MRGLPSVNVASRRRPRPRIDARAFSTTTGEIVWADSARDETSDASVYVAGAGGGVDDQRKLDKLIRPVVVKLAASFREVATSSRAAWAARATPPVVAGKIARVDGGTLYLNVGSEGGVKEGDEFNVFRMGDPIKDPDTGEVLGAERDEGRAACGSRP